MFFLHESSLQISIPNQFTILTFLTLKLSFLLRIHPEKADTTTSNLHKLSLSSKVAHTPLPCAISSKKVSILISASNIQNKTE